MTLRNETRYIVIILASIVILLFSGLSSRAGNVTARLYQSGGTLTFIELNLVPPAPAALIVEMTLPSGVEIVKTVPHFSKQNKNTVKWLLKNIKEKSFTIQLVTRARLDLPSSRVNIRYRNPDNGSIQEVQAR